MKGTCHLHIGLHKTGSTSIQKMLTAEKARLGTCGFYVPSTGLNDAGVAHHRLAIELNRQARSGSPLFSALAGELEAELWPHDVVLTSEGFSARIDEARIVARLRRRIERLGYRLRVIAYVRPQEAAIHSFYTQKLKMWTFKGDFDRFWRQALADPVWDYDRRFAALFDSGIELRVLPFSRQLIVQGFCRTFLSTIGVPEGALADFIEPPRANASPGPKAIAAIMAVNRELENRGLRANRHTLETAAELVRQTHRLIGRDEGQFNVLSADVAEGIRAEFRNSNTRFAIKAFGRKWEDVFADETAKRFEISMFDPTTAPAQERQAFETFVSDMADAICEIAE